MLILRLFEESFNLFKFWFAVSSMYKVQIPFSLRRIIALLVVLLFCMQIKKFKSSFKYQASCSLKTLDNTAIVESLETLS